MNDLIKRLFGAHPASGAAPAPAPSAPVAAVRSPATEGDINALYDAQAIAIMKRVLKADSACVDVGCHDGLIMDRILELAPRGRHYGFEPLPDHYAGIVAKYRAHPNVNLYNLALSEEAGQTTFNHVVSNPQYSGIRQRHYSKPEEVVQIPVRLARLDDTLPTNAEIRLVKVDVEGAELQVFRGATGLLSKFKPYVVFEHGVGAADCYGTRPEQVYDLLTSCGLKLSVMKDWLEGARPLDRAAFANQFYAGLNFYFLAHP